MNEGQVSVKTPTNFAKAMCFSILCFVVISADAQSAKPVKSNSGVRTISIKTEANASVWVDGVRYGKTDDGGRITITTVTSGKRALRVRADGFKEVNKVLLAAEKDDVEISLAKTSDEAELAFQLGETLIASDREKAAEAYNKAIRLRPKYTEAYIGLARVLSEAGEREKAEKAIRDLRKIRPAHAEASAIEGRILKENGDEGKAIAAFKRAIREGGGFQPEAYAGLGLLFKERAEGFGNEANYDQESANYVQAAKYLAAAIKQLSGAPDAVVIYQLLGLVYEQQKKHKEAIAVYEEFLRTFPDSSESSAIRSFIVQLKKQLAGQ